MGVDGGNPQASLTVRTSKHMHRAQMAVRRGVVSVAFVLWLCICTGGCPCVGASS